MTAINQYIQAIAPAYTAEQFVKSDDRRTRRFELRQLRQELPRVFGEGWNKRQYTQAELGQVASDKRFSESARSAAAFLASTEGTFTLERLNARSGASADGRFKATDLEGVNRELLNDRNKVVANADGEVKTMFTDTSKRLVDTFNSAITSVMQQHAVQPNSIRIE